MATEKSNLELAKQCLVFSPEAFGKTKDIQRNAQAAYRFARKNRSMLHIIKLHAVLDFAARHRWAWEFIQWTFDTHLPIFADAKIADTPSTTAYRMEAFAKNRYGYVTVSVLDDDKNRRLEEAVKAVRGSQLKVLAVGRLTTSINSLRPGPDTFDEKVTLVQKAVAAGAHGVICGATYPALWIRMNDDSRVRDLEIFAPGVGLPGDNVEDDDQPLRSTPQQLLVAGAHRLILGRSIGRAAEPAAHYRKYVEETARVLNNLPTLRKEYNGPGILAELNKRGANGLHR